jgi:hypothetical protein
MKRRIKVAWWKELASREMTVWIVKQASAASAGGTVRIPGLVDAIASPVVLALCIVQ